MIQKSWNFPGDEDSLVFWWHMLEADTATNVLGLVLPVWPVLVTLHPRPLLEVSQHHDHGDSLLNDHLPEVLEGDWPWSDWGDEVLLDVFKTDRRGIHIGDGRVSFKSSLKRKQIIILMENVFYQVSLGVQPNCHHRALKQKLILKTNVCCLPMSR